MELAHPLPSDGQLVDAAHRGMAPAWEELVSRHAGAVHAVARARRFPRSQRAAERTMNRLHREIVHGEPIEDGVAGARAVRIRALTTLTDGTIGPWAGPDDPAPEGSDDDLALATAFARLPEPWQTVLWHSVVEHRSAGEMTPLLGRGVNDVLALLHTSRSGLHQAYLRAIADGDGAKLAPECRPIVPLLAAAGRGALAAQDQRAVDAHILAGRDGGPCRSCRARLDLVATIDERLPAAIVPGVTGLTVQRYRQAIGADDRTFGAAALQASRTNRSSRLAIAGAAAAVLLAVAVAFLFIERPFDEAGPFFGSSSSPTLPDELVPTTVGGEPATSAPAGSTTPPTTDPDGVAPTTTELLLRPPPSGPANTVELVFDVGERALGVAAPELSLAAELAPAGRVFAAGTGTFDLTLTNTGAEPLLANFEVRTPPGLLFDALVSGDATCRGPREDAAFCNVDLAAGEATTLALRLRLESSVVGRLIVAPGPYGEPLELGIAATPRLVHTSVGRGDMTMIGNTVMSCADTSPLCAGARDLTGEVVNRWDVPLEFVGALPGWQNSSVATLDVAPEAGVTAAFLFWSGDLDERGQQVADGDARRTVTLLAPGGEPVGVEADRLFLGDVDATQYFASADVTGLVGAAGGGDYRVGNITSVETQGSYGGWALVVITADDAAPRRQHIVTSPFAWVAPEYRSLRTVPVPYAVGAPASLDVLAFEGEPGFRPEQFLVGGTALGGDNMFDGSLVGQRDPAFLNNFGIDIEAYDLTIDAPDGNLTIDATSEDDGVRLAVVGLAVELPS